VKRIVGLLAKVPEWWTATGVLWTQVPKEFQAEAANVVQQEAANDP
jgi:hypothetical protein